LGSVQFYVAVFGILTGDKCEHGKCLYGLQQGILFTLFWWLLVCQNA